MISRKIYVFKAISRGHALKSIFSLVLFKIQFYFITNYDFTILDLEAVVVELDGLLRFVTTSVSLFLNS